MDLNETPLERMKRFCLDDVHLFVKCFESKQRQKRIGEEILNAGENFANNAKGKVELILVPE